MGVAGGVWIHRSGVEHQEDGEGGGDLPALDGVDGGDDGINAADGDVMMLVAMTVALLLPTLMKAVLAKVRVTVMWWQWRCGTDGDEDSAAGGEAHHV